MFLKMIKNRKTSKLMIQTKLLLVLLFTTVIIFIVNLYMNMNTNKMISKIDKIYVSNANLNELQNTLWRVQGSLKDYLDTRNSDSMEEYFRSGQEYKTILDGLDIQTVNDGSDIMRKNISNMSESYFELTSKSIEAKRGRNVVKYRVFFEEASEIFAYIDTYIYNLNNEQFQNNSDDYNQFFVSLKYFELVNMTVLCGVGAINIILSVLLTRGITKPLKQLAEAANQVADGRMNIELKPPTNLDEVGVVTKAFNQMLLSIHTYIEQLKESIELEQTLKEKELMMEAHLKDAQLKYLQAQINPHFLFNTLNAGAQLAMLEDADRTYNYVQTVADFFRYNIKKNHDVVTLKEEIELVENYMYILNVRFTGDIHFKSTIDENLLDIQIPSMILQPIVENCVNHGIREIDWEKMIEISIYEEDHKTCISVWDNGVGINQDKISMILKSQVTERESNIDSNGIGLNNVINRLQLFYGKDNILKILSAGENKGTEIIISIPMPM